MNPIKSFDIRRIGLLMKKEIFYQRRAPWIIVGAVFIALMFFHILMASEKPGPNDLPANHIIFYIITLLTLGTIFTSSAFNELNYKSSAHHYLSIPASTLEKLISKWLVTGFLFVVAFNVFYFLYTLLSNVLTSSLFGISAPTFNPFEPQLELDGFTPFFFSKLYLAFHTVYLAGAIYFGKFAYFKTVIAQSTISLIMIGLIAGLTSLFMWPFWGENFANIRVQHDDWLMDKIGVVLPTIGWMLLFVVFPLWMLSYSYFKLKETEV